MSAPTVAFTITGPIARGDLEGLCQRVCSLLEGSAASVALCNVAGVEPDAVTVDALARLQLAARRRGCTVHLRGASDALLELVGFMGLSNVIGVTDPGSRSESGSRVPPAPASPRTS